MELKHQSALPQALHNRSPETLMPILQWMQKNISDPRYTSIIIDLTYQILGIASLGQTDFRYLWSGFIEGSACGICAGRNHEKGGERN